MLKHWNVLTDISVFAAFGVHCGLVVRFMQLEASFTAAKYGAEKYKMTATSVDNLKFYFLALSVDLADIAEMLYLSDPCCER